MAVDRVNPTNVRQVPDTEPQQAPKEPKTPKDNTAASQAPQETKTAVRNTFGSVSENTANKQETENPAKSPAAAPANSPKLAQVVTTNTINGYPIAQDKSGKQLFTPEGQPVVLDVRGNKVALDAENKIITEQNGNAKAVDEFGQFLPGVVYDKGTGNKVNLDERDGMPKTTGRGGGNYTMAAGEPGRAAEIYDSQGNVLTITGKGTPDGEPIFQNVKTGDLQTGGESGTVYKVDPATTDIARDADGKILPPLYNPVDSDTTRPPVQPNEDPATTIKNLPHSDSRGDPMQIKHTLTGEDGYLNPENVANALSSYDSRDVYDALINNSNYGGWNGLEKELPKDFGIKHPDQAQAKEIAAAMIAWQKENGKYNPLRANHLPPVVPYDAATKGKMGDYIKNDLLPSGPRGAVFLDLSSAKDPGSVAANVFNGLTQSQASDAFYKAYKDFPPDSGAFDIVTEYLANNWTGNKMDTDNERKHMPGFAQLESAVRKLGGGDRDKGIDMLKRAYFAGDASVIEELKKSFPPSQSSEDYKKVVPGLF